MPTEYQCPGCGASVLVPDRAAAIIGANEQIGCNNIEKHDDDKPLVMWEADDE